MDRRVLEQHRQGIRDIARRHGASRVRLFGSVARDSASPGSDLDLLVSLEGGRDLLDLIAIKQDVGHMLGCVVDVVEEGGLSPYLRERILSEAVPL